MPWQQNWCSGHLLQDAAAAGGGPCGGRTRRGSDEQAKQWLIVRRSSGRCVIRICVGCAGGAHPCRRAPHQRRTNPASGALAAKHGRHRKQAARSEWVWRVDKLKRGAIVEGGSADHRHAEHGPIASNKLVGIAAVAAAAAATREETRKGFPQNMDVSIWAAFGPGLKAPSKIPEAPISILSEILAPKPSSKADSRSHLD